MISTEGHELFRNRYESAERIVLVTHINPDGDAIGSEMSLARFLISRGKQVRIINNDPAPEILALLDSTIPTELFDAEAGQAALDAADRIILVDNSAPDRLGRLEQPMVAAADRILCIDHHPARNAPWTDNIVDVAASATTEMVHELTTACGWTPDLQAAQAIYVGLATDTGFFRFNSTTARSYEIAAEMVKLGVRPAATYRAIYERNSEAFTRLLGHALADVRLEVDGAVAAVHLDRQLIDRLQAADVDTSEIVTALLAMDRVQIAVLFRELPDGRVKVSLRSKGDLDVHLLATEFGGGGHKNASGIVMDEPFDSAARIVTDRVSSLCSAAG